MSPLPFQHPDSSWNSALLIGHMACYPPLGFSPEARPSLAADSARSGHGSDLSPLRGFPEPSRRKCLGFGMSQTQVHISYLSLTRCCNRGSKQTLAPVPCLSVKSCPAAWRGPRAHAGSPALPAPPGHTRGYALPRTMVLGVLLFFFACLFTEMAEITGRPLGKSTGAGSLISFLTPKYIPDKPKF